MDEAGETDADFLAGSDGLIAIDKVGNQALFLDPETCETVLIIYGFGISGKCQSLKPLLC